MIQKLIWKGDCVTKMNSECVVNLLLLGGWDIYRDISQSGHVKVRHVLIGKEQLEILVIEVDAVGESRGAHDCVLDS